MIIKARGRMLQEIFSSNTTKLVSVCDHLDRGTNKIIWDRDSNQGPGDEYGRNTDGRFFVVLVGSHSKSYRCKLASPE